MPDAYKSRNMDGLFHNTEKYVEDTKVYVYEYIHGIIIHSVDSFLNWNVK